MEAEEAQQIMQLCSCSSVSILARVASHRATVHLLVQVELPPRPLYLWGRVYRS